MPMMMGIVVMIAAGLGLVLTGMSSRQSTALDDETAAFLRQASPGRVSSAHMRKLARMETGAQDAAKYGKIRTAAGLLLILIGAAMLLLGIY